MAGGFATARVSIGSRFTGRTVPPPPPPGTPGGGTGPIPILPPAGGELPGTTRGTPTVLHAEPTGGVVPGVSNGVLMVAGIGLALFFLAQNAD
jgi:hypothetical protein